MRRGVYLETLEPMLSVWGDPDKDELHSILSGYIYSGSTTKENLYRLIDCMTTFNNVLEEILFLDDRAVELYVTFEMPVSLKLVIPYSIRDALARIFWKQCVSSKFRDVFLKHLYIRDIDADNSGKYAWCDGSKRVMYHTQDHPFLGEYTMDGNILVGESYSSLSHYTVRIGIDLGRQLFFHSSIGINRGQILRSKLFN